MSCQSKEFENSKWIKIEFRERDNMLWKKRYINVYLKKTKTVITWFIKVKYK